MWRYMTARDRYFQCLLRVLLYRNRDGYTFRIEVNAVYLDQLYGSRNVFIRLFNLGEDRLNRGQCIQDRRGGISVDLLRGDSDIPG